MPIASIRQYARVFAPHHQLTPALHQLLHALPAVYRGLLESIEWETGCLSSKKVSGPQIVPRVPVAGPGGCQTAVKDVSEPPKV